MECSRYVIATGQAPVVGWGRVPPGYLLWVPFSVFVIIFAFIAGGWAASAGQGVYALVHGEVAPAGAEEPRLWAIALLLLVFAITAAARRISRTLELANWLMVGVILVALVLIDLFVVPFSLWWEEIRGSSPRLRRRPGSPPPNSVVCWFHRLASRLNWYVMGHHRDKGYGMGHRRHQPCAAPIDRGLSEAFYYPFMLVLLVIIAVILHLALPVELVQWSANMSNLGALIYPLMLMYLNSKLPRPARPRPRHYVLLVANFLFFGFFFINFIADFFGDPLVTF